MAVDMKKLLNQTIILFIVGIMILIGQRIGYGTDIIGAIPGILMVIGIAVFALFMRAVTPKLQFPAFAWASLTALILSMPFMPTSEVFLKFTDQVNFLGTTTPILAFAGISVGNKILQLKKLSWKVAIVAVFVFIGTFFGSAIVSHIVLKLQGII
ncbi:MAG: hypothetical protein ACTHW2_12335 [Tissierella sp.]|uniref:hypothetical protein n=1 Tax=Tissierella sp. TaxID=41274 RepID=UPI003F9CC084